MKVEILEFPRQIEKLLGLVEKTRKEIMIVTPFYEAPEINEIIRRLPKNVKLRALIRASQDSDIDALKSLFEKGNIRAVRNLHAKILIFDRSTAIVSSLNIDSSWERGSLDVGVLIRGKVCKKLVALVGKWWKKGGRVFQKKINLLEEAQKRAKAHPRPHEEPRLSLGKRIQVQGFKPKRFEERHLILNINWNPHNYTRACTLEEAKKNICCHERRECLKKDWIKKYDGCASSYLFKDFEYATSKSAIKKDRLVFFIAKNPNLKNKYYFVGFLYMKSSRSGRPAWGQRLYFKGDRAKSIRFPSSGNKVIQLDENFRKKLGSLRGNPKYVLRRDAAAILREYFEKTRDRRVGKILEKNFGERYKYFY